jgi:hypothetical protein
MISPLEIHRASRHWGCGWLVAWTRLRCRQEYWASHSPATEASRVAGTPGARFGKARGEQPSPHRQ